MTGGWDFVAAAYAVAGGGVAALFGWAWRAARRAEKRADALPRR